jgi:iron complex outermembrane receptor protein
MHHPLKQLPLAISVVLASLSAYAQEQKTADPEKLQEVVVTAERVETTLRKAPVSVVAVGDLVSVAAGVAVPNGFSNMPQAVGIRGVGVSNAAMSQAVGVYVDDVPMVRGYATALWDLPDIERIEVLRGPQGTLYGQNTSAGAVKIVSRDPDLSDTRWVSVTVGNLGAREVHGYGTVGLGADGKSAASLAFSKRANDGFAYNATLGKDVNALDVTQFRAKLKSKLTPTLTAVLAVDGLLDRSDANTTSFPLNHPNSKPRVTYTGDADRGAFQSKAGGAQMRLEYKLANGNTLRSITAYRAYDTDPTRPDTGGLEVKRHSLDQIVKQTAVSQEVQMQGRGEAFSLPATWTVGMMAIEDHFSFGRFTTVVPLATNTASVSEAQTRQRTQDVGIYGQIRLSLSETTGLTLGLRGYNTRQTASNGFWRVDANHNRTTTVYDASNLSYEKHGLLPRIGLDYQASSSHLLYASISEGAKFGGFNRAAESLQSALTATEPEQVRTYELGSKSRFLDGKVSTNIALFYNDYRNYLASLNNTVVNGVLVTDPVLLNAGKAKTYGVDMELAAKLTRELEWTTSMEWLNTRFVEFANPTGAAGSHFVGHKLPYAPKLSANMGLVYKRQLDSGAMLGADVSALHITRQYADAANTALLEIPAQTYLNFGASYAPADSHWTFSTRVKNAQDKTYVLLRTRIPPLGVDSAFYNAPRTITFTARYDF